MVGNAGDVDIVAAPRDGALLIWRNTGRGHFTLATFPPGGRTIGVRGPRFVRVRSADDGWQWGDVLHHAAMPRAPDVVTVVPVAVVRLSTVAHVPTVASRDSSGRAPPSA
jgi:hypothetical protein